MSRRVLRRLSPNIFASSLTPWFLGRVLVSRLEGWADAWSEMLTPGRTVGKQTLKSYDASYCFTPLTAIMLNFAYFSPTLSAA
jgi:hypothetical protein